MSDDKPLPLRLRTKQISCYLDPRGKEYQQLRDRAFHHDVALSDVLIRAIRHYLKNVPRDSL